MGKGVRIGKILGININIDWSWLFIFFLVTWNLTAVFGQFHSDWSVSVRWGTALVASLLFFASVLAHELAHSLVARTQGVPVRNITLFLFGGVSNIQRHPPSPRAEFLITIVGPLTSFVLGLIFALLSGISAGSMQMTMGQSQEIISQLNPVAMLLLWLGSINILLAVFNLIPGFPLDGGRVLRAILWAIMGNVRRATRWASWVGQTVAWLFIVAGIAMIFGVQVPFFGTGVVGGLWLAFIGWFLNSASVQSYRQMVVQDILEDVPVREIMRSDPPSVRSDHTISQLVHDHVMGTDDHAFPVVDHGHLAGLVTLSDMREVDRDHWESTTVQEVMTPAEKLVSIQVDDEAAEAFNKLMRQDFRQLPVTEGEQLKGVLRRRDIIKWLQLHSEEI